VGAIAPRVIVTGGAGFIGSHTVELLTSLGFEVTIVDDLSSGHYISKGSSLALVDILSKELRYVFDEVKPNYVIHLAARTSVMESLEDPAGYSETNIVGTINVLENCVRWNIDRLVFASSASVYGPPRHRLVSENHPTVPLSFYGFSKLAAEQCVQMFREKHNLSASILRYSNVFGPRQEMSKCQSVVTLFTQAALNGCTPTVYGTGLQTRHYVHVEDVARANIKALLSKEADTFNVSTGKPTSVSQLLEIVSQATGRKLRPIFAPERQGDLQHSALDNTKIRTILGWRAEKDLYQGIAEMVQDRRYAHQSVQ
jgi:UDP-glucose 4-epimerase